MMPAGQFPSTSWTLLERLKSPDAEVARRALDELCTQYRYPLYSFIRRKGLDHHDAEDALQDFLAKLIRLDAFATADPGKGRLRAFLATALGRFLLNWHRDRPERQRESSLEVLEVATGEDAERYGREKFADHDTPERIFERKWCLELLNRVLDTLAARYAEKGRAPVFKALRPVLLAGGSMSLETRARIAAATGLSEAALRTALSRLLREYRAELEEEVFRTVASRQEVDAEIAHLKAVMQ